jgi:hypothetical protein
VRIAIYSTESKEICSADPVQIDTAATSVSRTTRKFTVGKMEHTIIVENTNGYATNCSEDKFRWVVKVAIAASSEAKHPNGDCEGD